MNISITSINLDLVFVGIAVAGIALLGFLIFFNNIKSTTNKAFLIFSIITVIWGVSNYLEYRFDTIIATLWALRIHLFISVWHALSFFSLAYIFPYEKVRFPSWYTFYVVPLVILISILTLTPFVFSGIERLAPAGQVTDPERGFGLIIFSAVAFGLLAAGLVSLLIKTIKFRGIQRKQTAMILIGMFLVACLVLFFNVVLPVTLNDLRFIPLAGIFIFPFLVLTSYTIYRHGLFNIKLVGMAFVAFLITVFSFINVIYSTDLPGVILNLTAFVVILLGSIQLIKTMLDLQVANEGQSALIHFINHQIKGYLSKTRNIFYELGNDPDYGPVSEAAKPLIDEGYKSVTDGVGFVQQILKASNIEKGIMSFSMVEIDFKKIVEGAAEEMRHAAEAKKLEYRVELGEGEYRINGDAGELKEAVKNFIDNSLRYTPSGSIEVRLSRNGQKILFSVRDTGVGLSIEDKARLFTRGGRGKDSQKINVDSTGFGLSIVKGIVEAHKGRVWAESDGKGKGSSFYMELPI